MGVLLCVYFLCILLCNFGGKLHNNVFSINNLFEEKYTNSHDEDKKIFIKQIK